MSSKNIDVTYIKSLPLTTRASNSLLRHGIYTYEQLRVLTREEVTNFRNCGITTADEIMALVDNLPVPDEIVIKSNITSEEKLLPALPALPDKRDYEHYTPTLEEWVNTLSDKYRYIFQKRMSGSTLEEIANNCQLTRERIRQILLKIARIKPTLGEDKWRYWYENYAFLTQDVMEFIFDMPEYVYRYYSVCYNHGYGGTVDFEKDPHVTTDIFNKYLDYCFQKQSDYEEEKYNAWHKKAMEVNRDIFESNPHDFLTAIDIVKEFDNHRPGTVTKILCRCICGKEITVLPSWLRRGAKKSCGCQTYNFAVTHLSGTGTSSLKKRTSNGRTVKENRDIVWDWIENNNDNNKSLMQCHIETGLNYMTVQRWWGEYLGIIKGIQPTYSDERSNKLMEEISIMTDEEKRSLIESLSWETKGTARHGNENVVCVRVTKSGTDKDGSQRKSLDVSFYGNTRDKVDEYCVYALKDNKMFFKKAKSYEGYKLASSSVCKKFRAFIDPNMESFYKSREGDYELNQLGDDIFYIQLKANEVENESQMTM